MIKDVKMIVIKVLQNITRSEITLNIKNHLGSGVAASKLPLLL